MDANRMQLAAALQARGNPFGERLAQQAYTPRSGMQTRQGMPQQSMQQTMSAMRGNPVGSQTMQRGYAQRPEARPAPMTPQPGFGGGGMQAAPNYNGANMFGGPAPQPPVAQGLASPNKPLEFGSSPDLIQQPQDFVPNEIGRNYSGMEMPQNGGINPSHMFSGNNPYAAPTSGMPTKTQSSIQPPSSPMSPSNKPSMGAGGKAMPQFRY